MPRKQNPSSTATPAPSVARPKPKTTRAKHTVTTSPSAAPAEHSPAASVAPAIVPAPTGEEIALLAYTYWEQRGCQGGSPEEDWLRAENELRSRAASFAAGV